MIGRLPSSRSRNARAASEAIKRLPDRSLFIYLSLAIALSASFARRARRV
jgi:hypothetical protein